MKKENFKITTWNINSIRIRLKTIEKFIYIENPDILCLQETKAADLDFPYEAIKNLGYQYIYIRGESSYNGVAILSKVPLELTKILSFVNDHARHISVKLPGGIELHNFYFPAGGYEPDPINNVKFKHKLDYISATSDWFKENKNSSDKVILLGDLNVAPGENDVWSHKQLLKVVSHTPIEVEKFSHLMNSVSFIDIGRKFHSEEEKLFSWWSYRNKDWKKSNRGRRLDHILITAPIEDLVQDFKISVEARDYLMPSDHVPVSIAIKLL